MKRYLSLCCLLFPMAIFGQVRVMVGGDLDVNHTFAQVETQKPTSLFELEEAFIPRVYPNIMVNVWLNPQWGFVTGASFQRLELGYLPSETNGLEFYWAEGRGGDFLAVPILLRRGFSMTQTDRLTGFLEAGVRFVYKGAPFIYCITDWAPGRNPNALNTGFLVPYGERFSEKGGVSVLPEVGVGADLKLNNYFHLVGGLRYRQGIRKEFDNSFWLYEEPGMDSEAPLDDYDLCAGTAVHDPDGVFTYESRMSAVSSYLGLYLNLGAFPGVKEVGSWGKRDK